MSTVSMSPLLRRALTADALLSAAAGVLMTLGADWLQGLLNLPVSLFMAAGVAMFPWAGFLLWLTRRPAVPRSAVWTVIAINALWVVDSAWVAAGGTFEPNTLGQAFVAIQALAVLVLVELQFIGLRRSSLAMA